MAYMLNNILTGKFEFKKGNTLASFAEALLMNMDTMFTASDRPYYDTHTGSKFLYPYSEVFPVGSVNFASDNYAKIFKVMMKLIPFYRHYFEMYLPQKKLVVLTLMHKLKMFDETLFNNFAKNLESIV